MSIIMILFLLLHVVLSLFLILLIMLQNDKGGGLAGAFGGMGGQAAFTGTGAANFLTRYTVYLALASFVVIVILNVLSDNASERGREASEMKGAKEGLSTILPEGVRQEAAPGSAPAAPGGGPIPGLNQEQTQPPPAQQPQGQ